MLPDLPSTIWLPALSHLTAEFSHIWLTCQKALSICWLLLSLADKTCWVDSWRCSLAAPQTGSWPRRINQDPQLAQHFHPTTTPDKFRHPDTTYGSCMTSSLSFESSLKLPRGQFTTQKYVFYNFRDNLLRLQTGSYWKYFLFKCMS